MFTEGKYYQQQRAELKKYETIVILHTLDSRPLPLLPTAPLRSASNCTVLR
jgi:hypothetical protein